jgi:hypothetical protein
LTLNNREIKKTSPFTQIRLDSGLDIASGLPGRPDAPAPVSNTVQPLRPPPERPLTCPDACRKPP